MVQYVIKIRVNCWNGCLLTYYNLHIRSKLDMPNTPFNVLPDCYQNSAETKISVVVIQASPRPCKGLY